MRKAVGRRIGNAEKDRTRGGGELTEDGSGGHYEMEGTKSRENASGRTKETEEREASK